MFSLSSLRHTIVIILIAILSGIMILYFNRLIFPILAGFLLSFGFISYPLFGISILNISRGLLTYNIIEIGPFVFTYEGLLTLLIIPIGILFIIFKKINPLKGPSATPFVLFLLFCFLGLFYASDYVELLRKWNRLLSYYILYVIIFNISNNRKAIKWLITSIFFAMIGPIIIGTLEVIDKIPLIEMDVIPEKGYVQGFMSKNAFGFFTAFMVLFSIAFYLMIQQPRLKKILLIAITCLVILLLLSITRAAWLGLSIGIIILFIFTRKSGAYLFLVILLSLILYIFYPLMREASLQVLPAKGDETTTWTVRKNLIWPAAWHAFLKSPIYGHGLGNDMEAIEPVKVVQGYFTYSPHNDYLNVLVETGLIGFSLYIWLIYTFLKPIILTVKKSDDLLILSLCSASLSITFAYLVGGVFEHLLHSPGPGGYFFTIVAMSHGAIHHQAITYKIAKDNI